MYIFRICLSVTLYNILICTTENTGKLGIVNIHLEINTCPFNSIPMKLVIEGLSDFLLCNYNKTNKSKTFWEVFSVGLYTISFIIRCLLNECRNVKEYCELCTLKISCNKNLNNINFQIYEKGQHVFESL